MYSLQRSTFCKNETSSISSSTAQKN
ncbi:hypothetical protein NC653_026877 [Populus alba x Populus x berolinensis]|uniref:Uncharacterized protein n=1 Tax=Populus alba x Populus x berolinensis TaxID=444605 RepID=A0AAD6Q431_9ROSI|nr:hypothetical protein NC653_026877 [Populus alba x Populus x berolinensis]